MHRPWQIWLTFAACLTVAVAAVIWLSVKALQVDQARAEARHEAAIEENARLALWRMDSFMTPIMAAENARPWSMFDSTRGQKLSTKSGEEIPVPVLPAGQATPYVLLHFQFAPGVGLTYYETPADLSNENANSTTAESKLSPQKFASLQAELHNACDPDALLAQLPQPITVAQSASPQEKSPSEAAEKNKLTQGANNANNTVQQYDSDNSLAQANAPVAQSQRSQNEFQARSKSLVQSNTSLQNFNGYNNSANVEALPGTSPAALQQQPVVTSMMKPLWMAGKLLLVRRVSVAGREYGQGCLLDWPAIKGALLNEVTDLLPQAELQPVNNLTEDSESHRLASLPVMLIPGALADAGPTGLSPIQQSLLIAWGALGLAAVAGVVLLRGVIALSERRAAFVSAVTHELRTPLTTFRMYAEMLSEGMVASEVQRHQYLETLRIEADRLTHLVANVLAYARLERGRPGGRLESVSVEKLLSVATQRLSDRAVQAQFHLTIEFLGDASASIVRADPAAVEQILFNLVDNACKYATSATDRTLHLSAAHEDRQVKIRLRDHGCGISSAEQRRLFQPFRKSAKEAAHSAPGVGLGLALSRRLAHDMHGNLCYEATAGGACFVLSLPLAE